MRSIVHLALGNGFTACGLAFLDASLTVATRSVWRRLASKWVRCEGCLKHQKEQGN